MARWMVLLVAAFFAVYTVTVLATGRPEFLVPAVILAAIILVFALANHLLTRRQLDRVGNDPDRAAVDNTDNVPSPAGFPDDNRPLGDTPEAHDEINPHDIPKWDASSRQGAEEQVEAESGSSTRGTA